MGHVLYSSAALPVTHLKWISMRSDGPPGGFVWLSDTSRASGRSLLSAAVLRCLIGRMRTRFALVDVM